MDAQALPKAKKIYELVANLEKDFEINLQVMEIGQTEYNRNGNRFQKCKVWDGEQQRDIKVWEGRTGMPLEVKNQGEWLTFSLSARSYKGNTYIGGFWMTEAPRITAPPPSAPQTPQNAPQATNSDDKWKLKDEMICRQTAGKAAAEIIAAFVPVSSGYTINQALNDALMLSDALSMWFINGNQQIEDPEEIPF